MELWELAARERIRDTLARYNWSGDAGRAEELADAFTPHGVLEVRGGSAHRGRTAIAAFIGGVAAGGARADAGTPTRRPASRRIVRHVLTNTRFLELAPDHASVASYFTVVTEIGLDHCGRYRDAFVRVDDEWLIEHRFVSTDWVAGGSSMAGRST